MMKRNFQISPVLAQSIVDAARELIGRGINFIQLDGEIIASTDPNRIGSFHEAALLVNDKRMVIEVSEK